MPDDASFSSDTTESSDSNADAGSASAGLSDAGISAMQGNLGTPQSNLDAPTEHDPQRAYDDAGDAKRAETGPEKTEVKDFHGPANPEVGAPTTPEGWRPGGPEG